MMDELSRTLRDIQGGAVARLLLADILHLAEREGILERVRRLSPVSCRELCRALRTDLGYALDKGNRRRMICLLLDLLGECGQLQPVGGAWRWKRAIGPPIPGSASNTKAKDPRAGADDQHRFFRICLDSAPAYLRGNEPCVLFDDRHVGAWERFLGCAEFRACRAFLLELMGIENHPTVRLLDLCHGPGWGLAAVIERYPAIRLTALDFTEVFSRSARARAESARAGTGQPGRPIPPIVWVGPDRWKGFGHPLPFPDASFEAVFFSCGDPYIPGVLRGAVYQEIARVLTPGGTLGVLTRCRPDGSARHVPSFWLRVSALAHDFAESVCEGWEGFSDAEENARMFSQAGFQGGVALSNAMSALESSIWILRKPVHE